ncbi:MAG: bidirectional hydrogenase complex protein HoxE [Anaerolineae bacterium]|nr:bidirectional hydrogenase complex protein HoxE [Anaerolineae bacterium]
MPPRTEKLAPPSDDKRWRLVGATMRRYGHEPHALIETLHTIQESFGYLDEESLKYAAAALHVPLSQVYGVATFYHFFSLKPEGEHKCVVCMGTACYIKGSQEILNGINQQYGVKPGETTPDGKLSVLTARCLGSCGLAPAAVLDEEVVGKLSAADTLTKIREMVNRPQPAPNGNGSNGAQKG